jgi:putative DNA primase/helicase
MSATISPEDRTLLEADRATGVPVPSAPSFRGRFVKPERPDSRWRYIPDTPQALADSVRSGAMFATWCAFSYEPRQREDEPVRFGDLPLDFDHKESPGMALEDLRRLCLFYLPEFLDIDPWDIQFFCSGGKGFHAVIPAAFFGLEAGHHALPLIYRRIAQGWASELHLPTLDLSMYAMGKGKMFRLPNVRRSNGRFKVPLSRDDLGYASIEDLLSMSESPRNA